MKSTSSSSPNDMLKLHPKHMLSLSPHGWAAAVRSCSFFGCQPCTEHWGESLKALEFTKNPPEGVYKFSNPLQEQYWVINLLPNLVVSGISCGLVNCSNCTPQRLHNTRQRQMDQNFSANRRRCTLQSLEASWTYETFELFVCLVDFAQETGGGANQLPSLTSHLEKDGAVWPTSPRSRFLWYGLGEISVNMSGISIGWDPLGEHCGQGQLFNFSLARTSKSQASVMYDLMVCSHLPSTPLLLSYIHSS